MRTGLPDGGYGECNELMDDKSEHDDAV